MTAIRKSFCFCREREGPGTGISTTPYISTYPVCDEGSSHLSTKGSTTKIGTFETYDHWLAPPPGSYFAHTHTRGTQRIQTTGSKFWDSIAYGQMSGSWEWTFPLDFEHIEPLLFVFEECRFLGATSEGGRLGFDTYQFRKRNDDRVRTFAVKIVSDNQTIGAAGNESLVLKGCVVTSFSLSKNNSASTIGVSLKGFYMHESLEYSSSLQKTVYKEPYSKTDKSWKRTAEWMGMFKHDLTHSKYMANVASINLSLDNSANPVYSVCSPFASNYYEGLTKGSMSAKIWYTDPRQYRSWLMGDAGNGTYMPFAKGMRPVDRIELFTTTLQDLPFPGNYTDENAYPHESGVTDTSYLGPAFPMYRMYPKSYGMNNEYPSNGQLTSIVNVSLQGAQTPASNLEYVAYAIQSAKAMIRIVLEEVAVKSYASDKGDGSPLSDTISSAEFRTMRMDVRMMDVAGINSSNSDIFPLASGNLAVKDVSRTYNTGSASTATSYTESLTQTYYSASAGRLAAIPSGTLIRPGNANAESYDYFMDPDAFFSHFVVGPLTHTYTLYSGSRSTKDDDWEITSSTVTEMIYGMALNCHALDDPPSAVQGGQPVCYRTYSIGQTGNLPLTYTEFRSKVDELDEGVPKTMWRNLRNGALLSPGSISQTRSRNTEPESIDEDHDDNLINIEQGF